MRSTLRSARSCSAAWLGVCACAILLGGCASDGKRPAAGSGRGGYYQGDGPGPNPPPNLADIPDAVFKVEPYARGANRPYSVFGQTYTPLLGELPYSQQGVASWYGIKFHGQRTSSGELYDMYKMTAAHPTLPIPSYVRITSLESGKQVVVRINDRGPFIASRLIDVSYTAAFKLGLLAKGSHQVQVDRILGPGSGPATVMLARREAPADISALMLEDRMTGDSAAPPAGSVKNGFYLQLGVFGRAASADDMRARLQAAGIDGATLDVAQVGGVFRLYRGPFDTQAQAREAMRELPLALDLKPLVIKR